MLSFPASARASCGYTYLGVPCCTNTEVSRCPSFRLSPLRRFAFALRFLSGERSGWVGVGLNSRRKPGRAMKGCCREILNSFFFWFKRYRALLNSLLGMILDFF